MKSCSSVSFKSLGKWECRKDVRTPIVRSLTGIGLRQAEFIVGETCVQNKEQSRLCVNLPYSELFLHEPRNSMAENVLNMSLSGVVLIPFFVNRDDVRSALYLTVCSTNFLRIQKTTACVETAFNPQE